MREKPAERRAILHASQPPTPEQTKRFQEFLEERYDEEIPLVWEESGEFPRGFRLEVGLDSYDWSIEGRVRQLRTALSRMRNVSGEGVMPLLRDAVSSWQPEVIAEEEGRVVTVGDGIATVAELDYATYGEILLFNHGIRGMIQDLREKETGCILFENGDKLRQGSPVWRTGKTAGVGVSEEMIGRVVDALGGAIDGKGDIPVRAYRPIESPAPGIIDRQSVSRPLETGILTIDSMFPIGKGQRELIIGDRQTGKTAIALDTILNQKGKDVICIYVSIGQKTSSVAQLTENLRSRGAMDYTIVVHASASDPAPLQYIAPYAGCAIGEYFMEQGKDVLIVYDDLSKHAIAYRTLSLLLGRSPGREAYPGDVFYLHSRLLERAAQLSEERGGGSMTALPIVETQAGDVSAYIPTNIISITDGQIFLESSLFFAGQRPAVNVGLSVSRVGGDAQTKAMKKAAGAIRLDLAQYREMEVFTQFSSDLDDATKRQLIYGQGLMRMLRQGQYRPWKQYQQVILLIAALNHTMESIPVDEIPPFMTELLTCFEKRHPVLCDHIDRTGILAGQEREEIIAAAKELADAWKKR